MGLQVLAALAVIHLVVASNPTDCENVGLLQTQSPAIHQSEIQLSAEMHEKPKTAEERRVAEFEAKVKPWRAVAKLLAETKLNCYVHPSALCSQKLKEYRKKVWPNIQRELGKNLKMFEQKGATRVDGEWRSFYIRTRLMGCEKALTYLEVKQSPEISVLTTLERYSQPGALSRGLMGDNRMCNLDLPDDSKAFVFVRNPLTRFVEAYDGMLTAEEANQTNVPKELRKPVTEKGESTASRARQYIENFLQRGGQNLTGNVLPQSEFFAPVNNCSLPVGFLAKREKSAKDWASLLSTKNCNHVAALPFLWEEEKTERSEESLLETLGSTSLVSGMKEALLANNAAYMRAFCWLSMPDYLMLDYDLPAPCLESDMGMVLDMAYAWKEDPADASVRALPNPVPGVDAAFAATWRSPRDLAFVAAPVNITLAGEAFMVYSAVPVFGRKSYVALLTDSAFKPDMYRMAPKRNHRPWEYMADNPIYCRSGGGRKKVQMKGRSLMCPWPSEDSEKASIKVILEDESGKQLGSVWARQVPGLLKKYDTMACVRDIFDEPNPHRKSQGNFSGAFKQLVEWVEFHAMNGVEHFLFYTYKGTASDVLEVMEPYIKQDMATRIHFDFYPWEQMIRQGFMANDCLFRAKNHAKWLMPTIDVDEYISPNPSLATGRYFKGLMDRILSKNNMEQVHQLRFERYRFSRSPPDELEISSVTKEPKTNVLGKAVVNTEVVWDVSVHRVELHDGGTQALEVPEQDAIIHHYRLPARSHDEYEVAESLPDREATVKDTSFKQFLPLLEQSLQKRFNFRNMKTFLRRMSQKRPMTAENFEKFDPWAKTL